MEESACSASDLAEIFSHLERADSDTLCKVQAVISQLIAQKQKAIESAVEARHGVQHHNPHVHIRGGEKR